MWMPRIQNLQISPNPVGQKKSLTVTVEAEDVDILFSTEFQYAASEPELYSGEEGMI